MSDDEQAPVEFVSKGLPPLPRSVVFWLGFALGLLATFISVLVVGHVVIDGSYQGAPR